MSGAEVHEYGPGDFVATCNGQPVRSADGLAVFSTWEEAQAAADAHNEAHHAQEES